MDNQIKSILKDYISEQEQEDEETKVPLVYDSVYQNPFAQETKDEIDWETITIRDANELAMQIREIYNSLDSVWVDDRGYFIDHDNKKLDGNSKQQIQLLRTFIMRKIEAMAREYKSNRGSSMVNVLKKYMEQHRIINPNRYPEWFTVEFDEVNIHGDLVIKPTVDVVKLLESGDNLRNALTLISEIERIWKRLTGGDAVKYRFSNKYSDSLFGRGPQIKSTYVEMKGLREYIKNVFNKEIKKVIKEQPGGECVHSIVFRARKTLRSMEFQIYPTFKRDCVPHNGHGTYYSQGEFKRTMTKILSNYGWINGVNYTDDTSKD